MSTNDHKEAGKGPSPIKGFNFKRYQESVLWRNMEKKKKEKKDKNNENKEKRKDGENDG